MTLLSETFSVPQGTTVVSGGVAAPDFVSPSWGPAVLNADNITQTSYNLSASAPATDATGVTSYLYQINGGALTLISGLLPAVSITGRLPGSTDSISMYARDAAGNTSAAISRTVTLAPPVASTAVPFQVVPNAMWTPGSTPTAITRGDGLYIGWVNDIGTTGITKFDMALNVGTSANLSAVGYQDNSHNSATAQFLVDGRLVACWSRHNDAAGLVYNLASTVEGIDTFAAGVRLTDGGQALSYSNMWSLSQNARVYVSYRLGGSNPRPSRVRSTANNNGNVWDTPRTWISDPVHRPYPKFWSDGVSRVHMVFTKGHPAEVGICNLFHAYMQLDGSNVETFYKTDGTLIGTSGVTTSSATAITSTGKQWVYDVVQGPDNELWVLYYEFVSSTDHRVRFIKTTGGKTAWGTPVEIVSSGGPLYALESYSHGGAVFNRGNPTKFAVALRVSGKVEMQEWYTTDFGASWAKLRDITSGSALDNFQPVSPEPYDARAAYVWCRGTYTYWDAGFSSSAWAIGE